MNYDALYTILKISFILTILIAAIYAALYLE